MRVTVNVDGVFYKFLFSTDGPAVPLRHHGSYASRRSTYPTCWAIDAAGDIWLDSSGCGLGLVRTSAADILGNMEQEQPGSSYELRIKLGMKMPLAEWAKDALSAGWTPPAGFVRSDYE